MQARRALSVGHNVWGSRLEAMSRSQMQRQLYTSKALVASTSRHREYDHDARWNLSVSATAISLAILASAGLFNGRQTLHAEAKQAQPKTKNEHQQSGQPSFTKDDVSLLCLIGYASAGKSTQAKNLEKRWGKDGWTTVKVGSLDELRKTIETRKRDGEQLSLIVDGFPRSWEEAQALEKEICEIFCFAFFNLEQDEWIKRTKGSKEEYKKLDQSLKPLREGPREKANILEITAGWPQDEVWEMVEAKVEQVIELREMGEM